MDSPMIRCLIALWFLGLLAGCATLPPAETRPSLAAMAPVERVRAEANLAVFNSVWDLVNRKHFDGGHNGVDWSAASRSPAPPRRSPVGCR